MRDITPTILSVTGTFLGLATVFVALRIVSRVAIVRKLDWSDLFVLIAWVLSFGVCFTLCYGTVSGLGRPSENIPIDWRPSTLKAVYALGVLYNPAIMAMKTSILAFYLTLTRFKKALRWLTYGTLFAVNAAGFGLTFLSGFRCRPAWAAYAYPRPPDSTCLGIVKLTLASVPANIMTDLAILFIPLPVLTKMTLPPKQKLVLLVTFSAGLFVMIVDVVRIAVFEDAFLQAVSKSPFKVFDPESDPSWHAAASFMWSGIEINTGIMCACVPTLRPLVTRIVPSLTRENRTKRPSHSSSQDGRNTTEPAQRESNGTMPVQEFMNETRISEEGGPRALDAIELAPTGRSREPGTTSSPGNRGKRFFPKYLSFGFVNLKEPRCMLNFSNKKSASPVAMTSVLFFVAGFAYGLLNILNERFEAISPLSDAQLDGLHAAFFGGYLISPCIAFQILKHWGFRLTICAGLWVYACGTIILWPAAVMSSFVAFLISNLIVGSGLGTMECAIDILTAICGPMQYSETRLSFAQGFRAVGSLVSFLLGRRVFFKSSSAAPLVRVQWAYLGITLFVVFLSVVYYYLAIPEASDDRLAQRANTLKIGKFPVVWVTLGAGAAAIFLSIGAQEVGFTNKGDFIRGHSRNSPLDDTDYVALGLGLFALTRFITSAVLIIVKPRFILLFFFTGLVIFTVLSMRLSAHAGTVTGLLIPLFEGGVFSIIFATSLRGTGRHTKSAGSALVASISGGGVFIFVQRAVIRSHGLRFSNVVTASLYATASLFAIYLNVFPAARKQVDPVRTRNDSNEDSQGPQDF